MSQPTKQSALDTVLDYHRAWTSGDVDGALKHVTDDVVCHAPGVDLTGKDSYRAFLGGFAPTLIGLTDVAAFGDDDRVALFYYPHTEQTSTAPAAELFTLKDGKIAESILLFDRLSFLPPQA
ncbi:nuclear transport factor 2 family protein [Mycobacterium sp. BMJ-28]